VVKFQVFWVKKSYKHGVKTYRYRGILLKVPKKFHEKIDPFIGKEFEMKALTTHETVDEEIIDIVLVRNKHAISRQLEQIT